MTNLLAIANAVMTVGILIGVWWWVFASKSGDVREVVIAFQEFVKKNFTDKDEKAEK